MKGSEAPVRRREAAPGSESGGRKGRIPGYVPVCVSLIVLMSAFVYFATRLILPYRTLHVLTGAPDARIPFSPPWVSVYLLAYPFWLVSMLWILSSGKPLAYRDTAAFVLALLLSGAVFLLWPGTMTRPEVAGGGFFEACVRWLYRVDSPTNLCPSLHVLFSYFCFRGAAESRTVPCWYKVFSLVFFALVCCSVLLVKQHALIDVPTALAVGELSLQCARRLRLERVAFALEKIIRKE